MNISDVIIFAFTPKEFQDSKMKIAGCWYGIYPCVLIKTSYVIQYQDLLTLVIFIIINI